ncbi:hypothetical protein CRG98_026622, partial [Punica granatum]
MARPSKEPCKKQACDIQACLSKNNFLPQKQAIFGLFPFQLKAGADQRLGLIFDISYLFEDGTVNVHSEVQQTAMQMREACSRCSGGFAIKFDDTAFEFLAVIAMDLSQEAQDLIPDPMWRAPLPPKKSSRGSAIIRRRWGRRLRVKQSQAMSAVTSLTSLSFLHRASSPRTTSLPAIAPSLSYPRVCTKLASTVTCCSSSSSSSPSLSASVNGGVERRTVSERSAIRLGLPSKGRMAADTLELLKNCQLSVKQVNPRQYVAEIPQLSNLEVWFQRPKDIVRKLLSGDLDLGMVGLDTVGEYGKGSDDLVIVHDALGYGDCRLSLAIPGYGIFENINSLEELAQMSQWSEERPLRVATGFTYLGPKFLKENGVKHVIFSTADGALEAAPAMGIADAILDLVSSGTTLRENNLKEIEGGVVLESE